LIWSYEFVVLEIISTEVITKNVIFFPCFQWDSWVLWVHFPFESPLAIKNPFEFSSLYTVKFVLIWTFDFKQYRSPSRIALETLERMLPDFLSLQVKKQIQWKVLNLYLDQLLVGISTQLFCSLIVCFILESSTYNEFIWSFVFLLKSQISL
jgi:hypothetical protein